MTTPTPAALAAAKALLPVVGARPDSVWAYDNLDDMARVIDTALAAERARVAGLVTQVGWVMDRLSLSAAYGLSGDGSVQCQEMADALSAALAAMETK